MKPCPALLRNQAAGCKCEIHGAELDSDDQIHSCERLSCSQPELPKTEAHVKQCPSSQAARRCISQVAAHPPVSVPDSGMRQSDLAGAHTSLLDDKEGGGNADSTSLALVQEENDLDTGACSTREDSDS